MMTIADFRYNLYRAAKRVALGPLAGRALGSGVCRTLAEGRADPAVARHISEDRKIASAYVQTYPFPDDFPPEFPRDAAFDAKFAYRLRDMVVVPRTGLAWVPEGPLLQESAGSLPRLFQKRVAATLRRPVLLPEQGPVIVFPTFGYYHVLFDVFANVLHALSFVPSAKILLPPQRPRYVDGILDFIGIPAERRIPSPGPVLVKDFVFAPLWVNGGFIPPADLSVLRSALLPKIPLSDAGPKRIYVSRSRSRNRPIPNEPELEAFLASRGFSIVHFEDYPFGRQLELVRNADSIVAPHGAGLANLVVARPGTRVVEILFRNWFNPCYAKLAVQIGCDYTFVDIPSPRGGRGGGDVPSPPVPLEAIASCIA